MRLLYVFVISWTYLVVGALSAAEQASLTQVYQRYANAVVGISCTVEVGPLPSYYGTGAVISAIELILTNLTVVPTTAFDIKITFTDGRIIPATLIAHHDKGEAALLKLEGEHKNLAFMPLLMASSSRLPGFGADLGQPVPASTRRRCSSP